MTLSFIIKFAMLVMNKRGSRGSLNLSKIRSKNKQVRKNAVTRLHGSFVLRVMGSCQNPSVVSLTEFMFALTILIGSLPFLRSVFEPKGEKV